MNNETGTIPVVDETPVVPVVEAPLAPVEQRYEYQPIDEQGRPIGGRQVIKYLTSDELVNKLSEQNTLLVRKLRAETRKNRLGIADQETIAEDAPRFSATVTFKPKSLTEEDRVRISRNLLDPDRFDEASEELFTAKLGVSPTELTKTISELQSDRLQAKAVAEANAFAQANPAYVSCQENAEAITNWLLRHNLAPVRANFQRAYETLKAANILVENVTVMEELPPSPPATVPEPMVEPAAEPAAEMPVAEEIPATVRPDEELPRAKRVSRVPVALNRSNTDETGAAPTSSGSDIVYEVVVNAKTGEKRRFTGLAAVDAMPADEYRRRVMTDPNFNKKVERLEQEKAARRKQR